MSSAPKKKKAVQSSVSVSEFKHWLSGVEDMQAADWVPDAIQWKKIREKIKWLVETEEIVTDQPQPDYHSPQPVVSQVHAPTPQQFFQPVHAPVTHYNESSLPQQPINKGNIDYNVPGTTEFS